MGNGSHGHAERVSIHPAHRLPSQDRVETVETNAGCRLIIIGSAADVLRRYEVLTHSNSKWQVGTSPVPGQELLKNF